MVMPCNCCPQNDEMCLATFPDTLLPFTPAAGGVLVQAGASGGAPRIYHFTNWNGLGFDGDIEITFTGPAMTISPTGINSSGLGGTHHFKVTFTQPVTLRRLQLTDLDNNSEQLFNFNPLLSGVSGAGIFLNTVCSGVGAPGPQVPGQGCIRATGANRNGFALWPDTVSALAEWTIGLPGAFGFGFPGITIAGLTSLPVYSCRMPDGTLHWYDSAGNEAPVSQIVPC